MTHGDVSGKLFNHNLFTSLYLLFIHRKV